MVRVLVIGAHPDDCESAAGGSAALWRRRGDVVRFVSVTDGDAGHHAMSPQELGLRRREEARQAAAVIGAEAAFLGLRDGHVTPDVANRELVVAEVRRFRPDLVLTHRPNDYHPDHRYTSTLVSDAAYLVTVPLFCPGVQHLDTNPVIAWVHDGFQKPRPFAPDVAVDIDPVIDTKWAMLDRHESQFYEWLVANRFVPEAGEPPADPEGRRDWLRRWWGRSLEAPTASCRARLCEAYGAEHAARVRFAEGFEICEFGRRPDRDDLARLFPISSRPE